MGKPRPRREPYPPVSDALTGGGTATPPKDRAPAVDEKERWVWGVFYLQVED
jgi:hypothetical protein